MYPSPSFGSYELIVNFVSYLCPAHSLHYFEANSRHQRTSLVNILVDISKLYGQLKKYNHLAITVHKQ